MLNKSIVVLPFKNLSGDATNDYFCDGITEEIINALSQIDGLKVIARTTAFAFKGKPTDIRIIGNELGVSNAVEGSIRIIKNRIRITAQLTRTDNGFLLWSEKFDRELNDVFELQDEISLLIADKIRENFGHIDIDESLATIDTHNLSAYQLYLKGRYYQLTWNLPNIEKAIGFYKKASEFDASYADPVIAIGWCYAINASWGYMDREEGLNKANYYLDKGLAMNPDSYIGYFAKATIHFWGNWQFKEGFQDLQNCLNINPHFTEGMEALAELFTATGYFGKALEQTELILKINPLSPNHHYTKGNIHYLQGAYETALGSFENSLKLDNSFPLSRHLKVACLLFLKRKQVMMDYAKQFLSDKYLAMLEAIYESIHNQKEIEYDDLLVSEDLNLMVYWDFYYLAHSKKTEEALERFELLINQRIGQVINFQFDPFLEPLRHTSKYQDLVQQVFSSIKLLNDNLEFEKKPESKTVVVDAEIIDFREKIKGFLQEDKVYLDSEISLRTLAQQMKMHPNKLSKLVNDAMQTNFNELMNSHRLAHFKEIAADPKNSHITLLGLAYDSGFNSKTVFNTYFKKVEGVSPRKWLSANS
ncbi:helix-turn-helix domain-containing protein [Seonamhaeicola marinus]|uniref:Helix-turn-helix domain-containing protein n=1 Tax=Seonamhaeicola marinus TaxID=1912246 RepID=A0A5D0HF15_9FLAO|nr:helix-turn-helix domain-containing protein [Seonamhaeicola marinus]TYA69943.1 helix-turn-helix domain-containing protein [Seonamhaeicola marinus]